MEGMELLQFHTSLYWAHEEVSAEFDAPAALPRQQPLLPIICWLCGWGGGHRALLEILERGKGFILPRLIARLLGCPAITPVTIPTELTAVTQVSLFLSGMFINCRFSVKLTKKFISVNWISWILSSACFYTKMLRPFKRFRCSCTDRET